MPRLKRSTRSTRSLPFPARALLAALLLLPLAPRARAQSPDMMALGRQEFEQGDKELNLGHLEAALKHFENSYRLTEKPALLFNLAYVDRQLFGRTRKLDYLEQAVERYKAFLDTTHDSDGPKVAGERARAEKELATAQDDLAREKAARAKGEATLQVGEEFLRQGKVDEARAQLERYRSSPGNERAGVVRAFLLEAGIALAGGDEDGASRAWASALELDPKVELPTATVLPPGASMHAAHAAEKAHQLVEGVPALAVTHVPPASARPRQPVRLAFSSSRDPMKLVRGVKLYYRAGSGAYSALPGVAPLGTLSLPAPFVAALLPGAKIEYYADVVDAGGDVLQHFGTPALPFAVEVEKPTITVAKKWWFWTTLGVVVAGGAVGGGLGWYYENPPPTQVPIQVSGLRATPW